MTGQPPASGPLQELSSAEELRAELDLVEREIEQARRSAQEARRAIGSRDEGAVDRADRSAAIEQAEEQERLVEFLTARRGRLQQRLAALG